MLIYGNNNSDLVDTRWSSLSSLSMIQGHFIFLEAITKGEKRTASSIIDKEIKSFDFMNLVSLGS